ncbi:MAG: hypothetical protein D6808_02860 [Candidatus Dadabacteria bacterium]|nr:MAG: hypothetical protein D6808_02860 [Candidatus Dadabacteria bacterium]
MKKKLCVVLSIVVVLFSAEAIAAPKSNSSQDGIKRAQNISRFVKEHQKEKGVTEGSMGEGEQLLGVIEVLCIMAGLVILVGYGLRKRMGKRNGGGRIEVIERAAISPKSYLALVRVEGRKVLVCFSGDSVSMLELDAKKAGFYSVLEEECKRDLRSA